LHARRGKRGIDQTQRKKPKRSEYHGSAVHDLPPFRLVFPSALETPDEPAREDASRHACNSAMVNGVCRTNTTMNVMAFKLGQSPANRAGRIFG
jgi:hypothetical protein